MNLTIFIPSFNSEKHIDLTIQSLLQQTYVNFHLHVIDNASTDNTVQIATKYISKFPNFRISVNPVNIGAEDNFNRCIELCETEFMAIYHADDVYHRDIVHVSINYLRTNLDVGVITTLGELIDSNGRKINKKFKLPFFFKIKALTTNLLKLSEFEILKYISNCLGNSFLICPSAMMRTNCAKEAKGFQFSLYRSSSDLGLWLNISKKLKHGIVLKNLISYRIHEGQGTSFYIKESDKLSDFSKVLRIHVGKEHQLHSRIWIIFARELILLLEKRRMLKKYSGDYKQNFLYARAMSYLGKSIFIHPFWCLYYFLKSKR